MEKGKIKYGSRWLVVFVIVCLVCGIIGLVRMGNLPTEDLGKVALIKFIFE